MQCQNSVNAKVIIRRATPKDSQQILCICKNSFPLSFRWQVMSKVALQWWNMILAGQASETWVIEDNGSLVAFCVLVIDEGVWAKKYKFRRCSKLSYPVSMLCHPIRVVRFLLRRVISSRKKSGKNMVYKELPTWWGPDNRVWLELIAVDINKRGLGLAKRLLTHCDMAVRNLGRKAIALRVAGENVSAQLCYEKNGFSLYHSDSRDCLYVKFTER